MDGDRLGLNRCRGNGRTDRNRAHQDGAEKRDQMATSVRTKHCHSPFLLACFVVASHALPYSKAVPIAVLRQKLQRFRSSMRKLAEFPTDCWDNPPSEPPGGPSAFAPGY
jgi:hypothetical protein